MSLQERREPGILRKMISMVTSARYCITKRISVMEFIALSLSLIPYRVAAHIEGTTLPPKPEVSYNININFIEKEFENEAKDTENGDGHT